MLLRFQSHLSSFFIITTFCCLISSCNFHKKDTNPETTKNNCANCIQLIDKDLHKGRINRDEAFRYKTYAIFDQNKLPGKYKSPCPIKGATLTLRDIKKHFSTLTKETKEEIRPYLFPAKGKQKR